MEKYFKRLPKENEGWKSKSTSKNDNMKKKMLEIQKKLRKAPQNIELKKCGLANENVHERIKSMEACPPKGDWHKFDHVYVKTT